MDLTRKRVKGHDVFQTGRGSVEILDRGFR